MCRWIGMVALGLLVLARPAAAWQDEPTSGEVISPLVDLRSEVEAPTRVVSRVPEGMLVHKGDVVVRLDDSALKDTLTNQHITAERALADQENAEKTREVAEIALHEYEEGIFPQELQALEGQKVLAEAELTRARDRLHWSEEMLKKENVTEGQVISDRLTLLRSEIEIKQNDRKMQVLRQYTYPKQLTELKAAIARARSMEHTLAQTHALERSKEQKIRQQIKRCEIRAPIDGIVVYPSGSKLAQVGGRPRGGQLMARIVPIPEDR